MENYLAPELNNELRAISAKGLAYIGDCVFELMVRTYLCQKDIQASGKLHDKTVSYVSATAQASVSEEVLSKLTEDEKEIYYRGRNAASGSIPKNAGNDEYSAATGLEALFGYLYLSGSTTRLNEIFKLIISKHKKDAG